MKLLLWLLLFLFLAWGIPYLRIFAKRVCLLIRLKNAVKKHGWQLRGTHRLWWLAGNNGKTCDFHLYTGEHLYSVKLFSVKYHKSALILSDGHRYRFRYYLGLIGQAASARIPIDGTVRRMPQYNFRAGILQKWDTAYPHSILLIHPVCIEICDSPKHDKEIPRGAGDRYYDMQIYSLRRFLARAELDDFSHAETF